MEMIFVQFCPTLLGLAQAKQTLSPAYRSLLLCLEVVPPSPYLGRKILIRLELVAIAPRKIVILNGL